MEKSKRKPAAAVKRPQVPLHAIVPSHTNQGGSLVLGIKSALDLVTPEPPSSPTLVVLESPASPKGATFTPSSSVKAEAPSASTPSVEISHIVPPPVDAPTVPSESCVAQDAQPCSQATTAAQQNVSSKRKAPAFSVDITGNKAPHHPGSGMLTRSSVQRISNRFSGSGGVPPTLPHP
ncbi:hypothetical protein D5086_013053 [Populus alba]|uniref:Uncharacterized protein n=1 Tax=Populus alba TaxID=43335 RepID=A0ACC4C463_POPAL